MKKILKLGLLALGIILLAIALYTYLVSAEISSPPATNLNGRNVYTIKNYSEIGTQNLKINDTNIYYQTINVLKDSIDGVICKSSSSSTDNKAGCDIICKSTDADCGAVISSKLLANKHYIMKNNEYTIKSPIIFKSGTWIDFDGSILNATSNNTEVLTIDGVSNIVAINFKAYMNQSTSTVNENGVNVNNASNVHVYDFEIYNSEDQDFSSKWSDHVYVKNFLLHDAGRNGMFIGFDNKQIFIRDGIIESITATTAEGYCLMIGDGDTYDITVDNVKLIDCKLLGIGMGAVTRGSFSNIWINGTSTQPDIGVKIWTARDTTFTNVNVEGSQNCYEILESPIIGSDGVNLSSINTTENIKIIGGNLKKCNQYGIRTGYQNTGTDHGYGNNIQIIGVTINQTGKSGISCNSLRCKIKDSIIENSNWYGIEFQGNSTSQQLYYPDFSGNTIHNVGNSYSGIYGKFVANGIVTGNTIYDDNGDMAYGVDIREYSYNMTVKNNPTYGYATAPVGSAAGSSEQYNLLDPYLYNQSILPFCYSNGFFDGISIKAKNFTSGIIYNDYCSAGSWYKQGVNNTEWNGLLNFPVACPQSTFMTQVGNSIICTSIVNSNGVSSDNLVLYLSGNNDLKDYSGNGISSTAINVSYNSGRKGSDFVFNGTNSYVNTTLYTNNNNLTYSLWVYPLNPLVGYQDLIENPSGDQLVLQAGSGKPYFQSSGSFVSTTPLTANSWNYVAVTIAGNNVIFYRNGIADGSGSVSGRTGALNNYRIGGSSVSFNGSMDEIMIYNRTLSASEVKSIYENNIEMISKDAYVLKNPTAVTSSGTSCTITSISNGLITGATCV